MSDGLLLELPPSQHALMADCVPPPPLIVPLIGRELIAAERGATLVKCDDDIRQIEQTTREKHLSDSAHGTARQQVSFMAHTASVARVKVNSSAQALQMTERSHHQISIELAEITSAAKKCEDDYELACGLLHSSDTKRLELQSEIIRKQATLDEAQLELQASETAIKRAEHLNNEAASESMRLGLQTNELESKRNVISKRLSGAEKRLEQAKCNELIEESQTRDMMTKHAASVMHSADLKVRISELQNALAAASQKHNRNVAGIEEARIAQQLVAEACRQQDGLSLDASAQLMAVEHLEKSPQQQQQHHHQIPSHSEAALPQSPILVPDIPAVDITSPEGAAAARDLRVEQLMSRHRILRSKLSP